MVFASAIGSLPKSGFPTACADALHSGGFTGEIDMDWRRIENDKEKYSAYLCSREWAERREAVRERADGKCERCGLLPMDACHHLTYERKYSEDLSDLQGICNACHEFTHGKSNIDPQKNARFIEWASLGDISQVEWLRHNSLENFLTSCIEDQRLLPVLQVWVAIRFSYVGAECVVAAHADFKDADGNKLEDVCTIPTDAELQYHRSLAPYEKSFWSWLCWGGPTQYPIGDKQVFDRCLELAKRLREAR